MPVPRLRSPWIAVATQPRCRFAFSRSDALAQEAPGEGMPRRFNSPAIQRGDLRSANHWKIRRTVSARSGEPPAHRWRHPVQRCTRTPGRRTPCPAHTGFIVASPVTDP